MESFHEAVGLWVIRGRHQGFDAPGPSQLLEDVGRKLRAPVGRDCRWDAVVLDPAVCEGVRDTLSRYVRNRDGYGPSGEAVDGCKQVAKPV